MITTTNLGLVVWDREEDDFDHSQLANNWTKLDAHNHGGTIGGAEWSGPVGPSAELLKGKWESAGRGLPVASTADPTEGGLQPGSIWRYLLGSRAVGHLQIGPKEVWAENIKEGAVGTEQLADESITGKKVKPETLTANLLHPSVLPLGSVIDWWRPPGSSASPEIVDPEGKAVWHICEGTAWSSVSNRMGAGGSELKTGNMPDLRKVFARGSSLAEVRESGGSATPSLAHTHTVAAHSHSVTAHTHAISEAGAHHHTFAGGWLMFTRQNAFLMGLTFKDSGAITRHNSLESLFVAAPQFDHDEEFGGEFKEEVSMDNAGLHNHGGVTGAASPSTSAVGLTTESGGSGANTEPPWYGLVKIMRVR